MSRRQNLADEPLHDDDPPFHRLEHQQHHLLQEAPRIHPAVIMNQLLVLDDVKHLLQCYTRLFGSP